MGIQHNERHLPTGGAVDKSAEGRLNPLDSFAEESVNGSMDHSFTHPGAPTTPTAAAAGMAADPLTSLLTQGITKKAVTYLRVSTVEQAEKGGQAEGFSIPAQRKANKQKALSLGAEVVEEFGERGVSGTSTNRPALQEMLKYLKEHSGEVDYVIVHKLDRLSRSRHGDSELNQKFKEYGVRLISTSEAIDESPSGLLLHGIMASIAEFYSRNLANEVVKGMSSKAAQGGTVAKAPVGYLNIRTVTNGREERTVKIDPERAPLVRWAFEQYATGNRRISTRGDQQPWIHHHTDAATGIWPDQQ